MKPLTAILYVTLGFQVAILLAIWKLTRMWRKTFKLTLDRITELEKRN